MPIFKHEDLYNVGNNNPRTRILFCQCNESGPLTVSRKVSTGKICLFDLYMEFVVEDPSEVRFAEQVFGDIVYWKEHLSKDKWFAPHLEEWRMAAAEKRKSMAFTAIIKEVKEAGKSAFTAAKYLIEEPWLVGASATEKKEIAKTRRATAEKAYTATAFQDDLQRLKEEGVLN